ncbi:MAG: hypothetical protein V9E81_17205 [Marmoricola sp.]
MTIEDTDDTTVGGVDDGIVIADSGVDHTITVINKYVKLPSTGAREVRTSPRCSPDWVPQSLGLCSWVWP